MAKGNFTATSASQIVTLPFQPDFVELWNYTNIKTAGAHAVTKAWWDVSLFDGANNPTMVQLYTSGATVSVFDTIQTNGIGVFSGGQLLQYGAAYQHTGSTDFSITKAYPAVVTTTSNHNLQTGDVVIFSNLIQTSTTGMQQMAGIPMMVTRTGAMTFTVNWNTNQSNYTAFNTSTSTNNAGSYKKVLYPQLYLPQDVAVSVVTTGSTTTISTAMQHGVRVGQEVAFRVPAAWGTTQLNSLPNSVTPGSPVYGYVISVTDVQNFVVNINSSSYTAFNSNQPFASVSGQTFSQVVPVGDVNTGGTIISSGSPLYPSPQWSYATQDDSSTINGPAIRGSFINNTSQGFTIGPGTCAVDTTSVIMASTNVIYWHAYTHDIAKP